MKKFLSLLLALTFVFTLVACSNEKGTTSEPDTSTTQTGTESADGTETTDSNITDESSSDTESNIEIDAPTTSPETSKPTTSDKDNATSSKPGNAINKPTISMPSTPPAKDTTTPTESTQTPADEPDKNPTDEPSDCEHTYTPLTCSCPKYCTKCEDIAANALPHNYQNGKCTVCGWSEIAFNIKEGNWVANIVKAGTGDQGEVLSQYILTQNSYAGAIVCYSDASSCSVNFGKVFYNEKTYYVDYYYLAFTSVDWEENGDTITVTSRHSESAPKIVLTKTSETQLTVIESNANAHIPVGTVFEKQ